MVVCFLCRDFFSSISALKAHLNLIHDSDQYRTFVCAEENCTRKFQLFASYKKHILTHEASTSTVVTYNLSDQEQDETEFDQNVNNVPINTSDSELLSEQPSVNHCQREFPVQMFEKRLSELIATLYASQNLPRNVVQLFVNSFRECVSESLIIAIESCLNNLSQNNEIPASSVSIIMNTIEPLLTLPLEKFSSEHKRLKYFETHNTYIKPESIVIGQRLENVQEGGIRRLIPVICEQSFISLRKVLQLFLSLEGLLIETLNYMALLNSNDTSDAATENFIQGSYWKAIKERHGQNIVMPIFMFFDDYETGNVLGSRSGQHKLGAVYVSLPCLPPTRVSILNNIFLVLLFHSSDRVNFGNRVIFQCVIDELNYLAENGIYIDVPNFSGKIYFELGLILGDNLGIHSITGFLESFSANYPCRICKVKKNIMKQQCEENVSLLRNIDNYESDLMLNNPSETGIKEKCIWLSIKNFSLFDQVGVDWMHDILEGVAKYAMTVILNQFVRNSNLFSIDVLNQRMHAFTFGPDDRNAPCSLSWEHINQGNIRLSASEMLTFVRYFGLLVGEYVPNDNQFWKLYVKLRQIIDTLSCTAFAQGTSEFLQTTIKEFNSLYLSLSSDTLKPKFHNLVHYHSALEKFGPIIHISSMRFEAKHRISKIAARASNNRRNLTLTIAMKHQLNLNNIFLNGKLDEVIKIGPILNVTALEVQYIIDNLNLPRLDKLTKTPWATVSCTLYKVGTVLIYSSNPDDLLQFFKLTDVYLFNSYILIVKGFLFNTLDFDEHFQAYEVEEPLNQVNVVKTQSDLISPIPCNINYVNSKYYVTLRSPV